MEEQRTKMHAENKHIRQDIQLAMQVQAQLTAEMEGIKKEREAESSRMAEEHEATRAVLVQEKRQSTLVIKKQA